MVVTPLLKYFSYILRSVKMVVTPLLIIFQLYRQDITEISVKSGGYPTFNNISVISCQSVYGGNILKYFSYILAVSLWCYPTFNEIFQLYPGGQFMVVTPLLIIFQLYPGSSVNGGYPTFINISVG